MDNATISGLIVAAVTAVLGLIIWRLKKFISSKSKSKILKEQLEKFYAPLYNDLISGVVNFNRDLLIEIHDISKSAPNSIPQYFLDLQKTSLRYSEKDQPLDFEIKKHIETNYYWLRNKFGYSKEKIDTEDYKYLDNYSKLSSIAETVNSILLLLPVILSVISTFFFSNESNVLGYIFLSATISCLVTKLLSDFLHKWMP